MKAHNVICNVGEDIETSSHYLRHCRNYLQEKMTLLTIVGRIDPNIFNMHFIDIHHLKQIHHRKKERNKQEMELQKHQLNFEREKHEKEIELHRSEKQNQRDFNTMKLAQMQADQQASQQQIQQIMTLISGLLQTLQKEN